MTMKIKIQERMNMNKNKSDMEHMLKKLKWVHPLSLFADVIDT
jgi:hypothetical protein